MAWANGNGLIASKSGHGPLGQELYEKVYQKHKNNESNESPFQFFTQNIGSKA
jgi:hypothetical protein